MPVGVSGGVGLGVWGGRTLLWPDVASIMEVGSVSVMERIDGWTANPVIKACVRADKRKALIGWLHY